MENTYPYLQEEADQTSTETALLGLEDQYTPLFGFVERTSIFDPENHQLKEDESFHTNLPLEPDFVDNFEFEDTNLNELFTPPHKEDIGMKLEELEKSHDNLNSFDQMEDIKTHSVKNKIQCLGTRGALFLAMLLLVSGCESFARGVTTVD